MHDDPGATRQSISIRVLTLNVWNTNGPDERQAQVRNAITILAPDLICLQEVVRTADYDQLEYLLEGSALHGVHDTDEISGDTWGTAIATRWKPTHVESYRLESDVAGPTMIAAKLRLPIGEEMAFIGVKPSYKFTDEALRCRQAVQVSDHEHRLRGAAPSIIAGDFDASPDHDSIRFYLGQTVLDGVSTHFRDAWTVAGNTEPGHTWTTDNAWVRENFADDWIQVPHHRRIDFIFLGSPDNHPVVQSTIRACRLVGDTDPAPSDHYGVLADITLRRVGSNRANR